MKGTHMQPGDEVSVNHTDMSQPWFYRRHCVSAVGRRVQTWCGLLFTGLEIIDPQADEEPCPECLAAILSLPEEEW